MRIRSAFIATLFLTVSWAEAQIVADSTADSASLPLEFRFDWRSAIA